MSRWSCGKKVRYESVPQAMQALELGKRTWRFPPVRWYKCDGPDSCGGYHITSQPKAEDVGGRAQARNASAAARARGRRAK